MEFPTSETIREALLAKAKAFCQAHRSSFSAICNGAGIDNKFLHRVEAGENFNVKTYQRVMDWLDSEERERAA